MKKGSVVILLLCIIAFITVEAIGRYYGLTTFPLFIADPNYEYISAPNQNVKIYRHRFITNAYSQRSLPIEKTDSIVYLLIGDSVVYGGNSIDQDSLASARLEYHLSQSTGRHVRVLNISSKSWGPDNAAAYVRKYGTFGAKKIVLVFSSHDAHDNMTFRPVIGVDDRYPDHNTFLAWPKLIEKGWQTIEGKLTKGVAKIDTSGLKAGSSFNSGFDSFRRLSDSLHIPLIVYLHKTTDELARHKLDKGGLEIKNYCLQNSIPLIEGNETPNLYEDYIHFNKDGQRFLSEQLYPIFRATNSF